MEYLLAALAASFVSVSGFQVSSNFEDSNTVTINNEISVDLQKKEAKIIEELFEVFPDEYMKEKFYPRLARKVVLDSTSLMSIKNQIKMESHALLKGLPVSEQIAITMNVDLYLSEWEAVLEKYTESSWTLKWDELLKNLDFLHEYITVGTLTDNKRPPYAFEEKVSQYPSVIVPDDFSCEIPKDAVFNSNWSASSHYAVYRKYEKAAQCLILSLAKDQSSISFYIVGEYLLGTDSGLSSMETLDYMRTNDKYKDMLFDKPGLGELFLCIAARNSHKSAQQTVKEKGFSCSEIEYPETINLSVESVQN